MFRKKSNHTKITCSSRVLSDILRKKQIDNISISQRVDISTLRKRKEYTLVEIDVLDDRIIAGNLQDDDDVFEIQRLIMKDIKECDSMLVLEMQYTNNNVISMNLIGRVFKVKVDIEELKLKIKLFINK